MSALAWQMICGGICIQSVMDCQLTFKCFTIRSMISFFFFFKSKQMKAQPCPLSYLLDCYHLNVNFVHKSLTCPCITSENAV